MWCLHQHQFSVPLQRKDVLCCFQLSAGGCTLHKPVLRHVVLQGLAAQLSLFPEVAASKAVYWKALAPPPEAMLESALHAFGRLVSQSSGQVQHITHNCVRHAAHVVHALVNA